MSYRSCLLVLAAVILSVVMNSTEASPQVVQEDSVVYRSDVERMFTQAMNAFKAGRYDEAAEGFSDILDRFPGSHRATAALVMGAKSRYELGEFEGSEDFLRELLTRYPRSAYVDDAHYTLGLNSFRRKQFVGSAREFLQAWQTANDSSLRDRSERMLAVVASTHLQIAELQQLLAETGVSEMRALLSLELAKKIMNSGDVGAAMEVLQPIARLPRTSPSIVEAAALLDRLEQSGVVKIGVVLPIKSRSDPLSAGGIGEELLTGIRLAVDAHNAEVMPKVNLDIRDSERDAGVAARQVSELSMDSQVLAIVGPLFSNEAIASAPIANARRIPLITPTATATGIAAVGEYIFQANPDYSVHGRAVAEYAYQIAQARRFAVLSASDTANKQITAAFLETLAKLGGEIIDVQWYNPGETDLQTQLFTMRQRAMEKSEETVVNFATRPRALEIKKMTQWGVPQRVLDSLIMASAQAPVQFLFGSDGERIADSLRIPTQRVIPKYDSLAIPVTAVDALFLPIANSSEIPIVASQVRYFNFKTQLLGTGNWNDLNELDQNRQYTSGVLFSTDIYWEEIDQQYRNFARGYRASYSKSPTANAMYGYDVMNILLKLVRNGATRREEILSALATVRSYQGVHAKICFSEDRVNSCVTLLQFKNRSLKKIAEINADRNEITISR